MSRLVSICGLCLLTAASNGQPAGKPSVDQKAAMSNPIVAELARLPPDFYFADSHDALTQLEGRVNEKLMAGPRPLTETLLIQGVPNLDLEHRSEMPALLVRYATGLRDWKVSTALNFYLIAQDLDRGTVKIQSLAERDDERTRTPKPSASGAPPDANTAESTSTTLRRYPMRRLLNLDWQAARWAFTVIDYDAASNTFSSQLTHGKAASKPEPPVLQPSEFLKCLNDAAAPDAGVDGAELVLAPAREWPNGVSGHIRTTASSVATARSSPTAPRADLIRATLLFVALDQRPRAVDMAIPATPSGDPGPAQRLTAKFCFDPATVLGKPQRAGLYQVFLLAGSHTFGPLAVKLGA